MPSSSEPFPDSAATSASVRLATPRILVVDDDEDSQFLLRRALRGCGELAVVSSAQQALESIRTQSPDLIILDCEMPGMSGLQLCDRLKADSYLADVPVVFVTNHQETNFEVRALKRGAVDFLTKPVVPEVVRARVGVHLALKRSMDELRRLTSVDSLTGLPNRRAFDEGLDREWRRALRNKTPITLMMIDVDRFKDFNDAFGHLAGDVCLRQVALALQDTARRPGDLVARWGGEEFAILLPHSEAANAEVVAQRVREAVQRLDISHPVAETGRVTVSIGICGLSAREANDACIGHGMVDSDIRRHPLIEGADRALYAAKRAGRNRAVVVPLDDHAH